MARITIEDLPVLEDLTPKETKGLFGGYSLASTYDGSDVRGGTPDDGCEWSR